MVRELIAAPLELAVRDLRGAAGDCQAIRYGVGGVLAYMTGLLVVEILVVLTFGVEPRKRRLEEIENETGAPPFPAEARNP